MSKAQGNSITPLEALCLLHAFGKAWGRFPVIELSIVSDKRHELAYDVKVTVEHFDEGRQVHVPYTASSRFPNSSHTSMLALWIWLAHSIDQQIDASLALRSLGD